METRPLEQLRQNDNYVFGDSTRFAAFARGDHTKEKNDPATLLLKVRDLNYDFSSRNTDALVNELRTAIGENTRNLALLDFDRVRGELRNLWGNDTARMLMTELNAYALKLEALVDKYDDRKERTRDQSWIVQQMIDSLSYDYTKIYGDQRNTYRAMLEFVKMNTSARFRLLFQAQKWDPTRKERESVNWTYGSNCSWQLHAGSLIMDAIIALSGNFHLVGDPEDPAQIGQRERSKRRVAHEKVYLRLYGFTVGEAMRIKEYVLWANCLALFRYTFPAGFASQKIQNDKEEETKKRNKKITKFYLEWYCMTLYDWIVAYIKQSAAAAVRPLNIAYQNIVNDIKLAMNQREQHGGITRHIYNRIVERTTALTAMVRNLTGFNYVDDNGQTRTYVVNSRQYRKKYGADANQHFPAIRYAPQLDPRSIATNVPPELDGRDPNVGGNNYESSDDNAGGNDSDEGGGMDSDDRDSLLEGDTRNDGDDDDDGDAPGNAGPTGGGPNRGGRGGGPNRGGRGGGPNRGGRGGGPNRGGRGGGRGRGDGGGGRGRGDGGGGGGGRGRGDGGGGRGRGGGAERGGGRRSSWGGGANTRMGLRGGDGGSEDSDGDNDKRVCMACPTLSEEPVCTTCGGETFTLWPNKRLTRAREDDEVASPNKRLRTILNAQAVVDNLSDQLQNARIDLSTGRFHSTETISSDYPDSFKQTGPEFSGIQGHQHRFRGYRRGSQGYPRYQTS
ncbi:hypothetical protein F5X98DRAFT_389820 [Xylaria grammica]|nr:hypothetical protein F5X98DRAFT_389820 [Xylaria grammica]